MTNFVGRQRELSQLDQELRRARSGRGSFSWITGRRRVGKSRLVQEFVQESGAAHVFFQCPRRSNALELFVDAIGASSLPAAALVAGGARAVSWQAALRLAASGATRQHPVVIVLDEYPYLHAEDSGVDADVQAIWDQELERLPVMVICIGSDLAMMERLLEHDRPLHGRPTSQLRVDGLDPLAIATLLQLDPADALDAYLVVGGFPAVALDWKPRSTLRSFLKQSLAGSSSTLVTNGERILNTELAGEFNARAVLEAIGLGERGFTAISAASGVQKATLERSLKALLAKQLIERRQPLAIPPGKTEARYQVIDAGLRFWLRFIGPHIDELERGRGDLVIDRVLAGWSDFRGPSIEPVIREALTRTLPATSFGSARHVGGYWTRSNDPEIDLVGADRLPVPSELAFVGSIKWRSSKPFGTGDAAALARHRGLLPGATDDTLLIGVSRSGFDTDKLDIQFGPEDVMRAFQPRAAG